MGFKRVNSTILITLSLLGTIFIMIGFVPNLPNIPPIVPSVHASPPNNPATLGLFSEVKKSNAYVDTALTIGQFFKMDVNLTDAGLIKGFDVNVSFASASIVYQNSSYTGSMCTSASGCIFASPLTTILSVNATTACKTPSPPCVATGNANWYRLAVSDNDQQRPFITGNGVLFRLTFKAVASSVASVIHIETTTTTITNPSAVPYAAVDGYFDSRSAKSDFTVSESPRSLSITRWSYQAGVNGNSGNGATTVTIAGLTGLAGAVTYKPLSLPSYAVYSNGTNPCGGTGCTSTLTIWVSGGQKGSLGETVIYDGNSDGKYSHGKFFNDTLIAGTVPTNNTAIATDAKIKFIGAASTWAPGNTVVYDSNSNGVYDAGEPVVSGSQPAAATVLKTDPKLKYWDKNVNGVWDNGATPTGTYSIPIIGTASGTGVTGSVVRVAWLSLTIVAPAPPVYAFAASLSTVNIQAGTPTTNSSTRVTLTATLNSGSNDSISVSNNCNIAFSAGSCPMAPVASQSGNQFSGAGSTFTSRLNFTTNAAFTNSSAQPWQNTIIVTATTNGYYSEVNVVQTAIIVVRVYKTHDMWGNTVSMSRNFGYNGVPLSGSSQLQVSVKVTNLGTVTETNFKVNATAKTVLTPSNTLRWIDNSVPSNTSAPYKTGETVIQDNDGNGVYGYGKADSGCLGSSCVMWAGAGTSWTAGNPVVYDNSGDGIYRIGKFVGINDTIISGAIANNTALKTDLKLKIVDCTSTSTTSPVCDGDSIWNCTTMSISGFVSTCTAGEAVFYDTNGNGVFDTGEPIVFGSAPLAEPLIFGTSPAPATALSQNTLSFVDQNYNGALTSTASIAFDANGNGVYDAGEPVVDPTNRGTPSAGILVGRTTVSSIAPNANVNVTISWDPSTLPRGRYMIAGWAEPVTGEYFFDNNIVLIQTYNQRFKADISGDCVVDVSDLAIVGGVFGKTRSQAGYNAFADINNDAVIDVSDLAIVGAAFGSRC